MNSAILTTNSNKDLQLLIELAKKMGIKTKILTAEQKEDLGLLDNKDFTGGLAVRVQL